MALTKAQKLKKEIKNDLLSQLKKQGKTGKFFNDLVEDYIYFWELKSDLKEDIDEKGLRIETTSGNGFTVEKANESVQNLFKINSQMLKTLADLGLQEPTIKDDDPVNDYL